MQAIVLYLKSFSNGGWSILALIAGSKEWCWWGWRNYLFCIFEPFACKCRTWRAARRNPVGIEQLGLHINKDLHMS